MKLNIGDYPSGNYPMSFGIRNESDERPNPADDSRFSGLMFEYAWKMRSWRMANDESTLTGLRVGLKGLVGYFRNYGQKKEPII
jgi:hypothetical protein